MSTEYSGTSQVNTENTRKGMSEMTPPLFVVCFVACIFASSIVSYRYGYLQSQFEAQSAALQEIHEAEVPIEVIEEPEEPEEVVEVEEESPDRLPQAEMIYSMQQLYELNEDTVGWITIPDTNVDYPVMQSMYDEEYYLNRDFQKQFNMNGCLIMDTDSVVGSGTAANDYRDGTAPGTNLIIHGHNMKNGSMFGNLDNFRNVNFEKEHTVIKFSSLYEEREYKIISVFLSQVYLKTQNDVFKYYKFFEAKDQEEFDDWYRNIKALSLYDTGVNASFGDEFITLSVCAYHTETGRLVVVGKRVK